MTNDEAKRHCHRVGACDCAAPADCEMLPQLTNPVHRKLYIIGSLRNEFIPKLAEKLRCDLDGWEIFDDWHGAGPKADDHWRDYELNRGRTFEQAVVGYAAQNVLAFDKRHLTECTHAVLVLPAGRSGHLELGFSAGLGKKTFILLDGEYDRWDVMYGFADVVVSCEGDLIRELKR